MGLSTEDLDQIAAMIRNSRNSDRPLKADVDSASDDFSNTDQVNAGDLTEQLANIRMNKKRTYDVYQDLDIAQARKLDNIFATHLANTVNTADMISKQAIRHSDVAADALWTDELNPVVRGAGDVLAGQAPVNSQGMSTASLDTVFTNITAQNGELVTAVIGLANSQAAQNLALAQLIQNAKQSGPATPTAPATA
jgi:hypothetical protein